MDRKEEKTLLETSLPEFFMERVKRAMARQAVSTSALAEFYLINLLQEFRKSENLFEKEGSKMFEKPLALLFAEAVKGGLHTKIRCFKKIGDLSLYTTGFFSERIKRKLVDIDYYIRMGEGAYQNLSILLNRQKTFAELYAELAQLFPSLVDVLTEVALESRWKNNTDLLKLYERWLQTGNEYLEDLLKQEGIQTGDRNLFNKIQ